MALRKKPNKPRPPKRKTRTKNKPTTKKPVDKRHNGKAGDPWHRRTKRRGKPVPKRAPQPRARR